MWNGGIGVWSGRVGVWGGGVVELECWSERVESNG